jgi:hypothetical protein
MAAASAVPAYATVLATAVSAAETAFVRVRHS